VHNIKRQSKRFKLSKSVAYYTSEITDCIRIFVLFIALRTTVVINTNYEKSYTFKQKLPSSSHFEFDLNFVKFSNLV